MKVTPSICKMTFLSSLSSLLSSHPPHQGVSQRIWHLRGERGGERGGPVEEDGRQTEGERRTDGGSWREEGRVDRYLGETSNLRRCGPALLRGCAKHWVKNGNQIHRSWVEYGILYGAEQYGCKKRKKNWDCSITVLKVAKPMVCYLVHTSAVHVELKLQIT